MDKVRIGSMSRQGVMTVCVDNMYVQGVLLVNLHKIETVHKSHRAPYRP